MNNLWTGILSGFHSGIKHSFSLINFVLFFFLLFLYYCLLLCSFFSLSKNNHILQFCRDKFAIIFEFLIHLFRAGIHQTKITSITFVRCHFLIKCNITAKTIQPGS